MILLWRWFRRDSNLTPLKFVSRGLEQEDSNHVDEHQDLEVDFDDDDELRFSDVDLEDRPWSRPYRLPEPEWQ